MNQTLTEPAAVRENAASRKPLRWYDLRWWFTNFLVVSVIAHIFFGLIATYFIVQVITAKRKQDFAPGPAGPSAPTRALEHKVQMQKKQAMSAPAATKRVTTSAPSKVSLPALPAMPTTDTIMPTAMAGLGGTGVSLGAFGGGGGGGNGLGQGLSMFGSHVGGQGLVGTFYDLKQNRSRQPIKPMNPAIYGKKIAEFAKGDFNPGVFANYFRGPRPLYATQIFTPEIDAKLGPAAFDLQDVVEPKMWCVHYRGKVRAPESGTFHFVGTGDDILIVKFDGKILLDACYGPLLDLPGQTYYHYRFHSGKDGFAKGPAFIVESGQTYPMEVIIGEQPGGYSDAVLLIEKEGQHYEKDGAGNPILPIFRMSSSAKLLPPPPGSHGYAPHAEGGPVWAGTPDTQGLSSSD